MSSRVRDGHVGREPDRPDTTRQRLCVVVHPQDNVAVALRDMGADEFVCDLEMTVRLSDDVPSGHKFALWDIAEGEQVYKFGFPIGVASKPIPAGAHVHVHNLKTTLSPDTDFVYRPPRDLKTLAPRAPERTFRGYLRQDGRVGTRNEVWILNTVGCVNHTAQQIADICSQRFAGRAEGFHAFGHPFGCSQLGDDLARTRKLLAALINHPNAGGVLVLGLGCENNQLSTLLDAAGLSKKRRVKYFNTQEVIDEIEAGVEAVEGLLDLMSIDQRSIQPVSKLVLGMKCGGSDGLSGLTANPLVGRISDYIASAGGYVLLTETPEMFGAEQVLMDRAKNVSVFNDIVQLTNSFRAYFAEHGQPVYENPSPGNKSGGITTLEEKSLGAIQKGGQAIVTDVLGYGSLVSKPGLSLLEGPGNDAVSSTALTAAGATVLLFTTGRGTPLGFPTPTLKVASNSALAKNKPRWVDFDAGRLLSGNTIEILADELLDKVIKTASGAPTWNEKQGYREIAIWKDGVTL